MGGHKIVDFPNEATLYDEFEKLLLKVDSWPNDDISVQIFNLSFSV